MNLQLTRKEAQSICGVLAKHPGVQVARVFGSRAKGCARANSDVDLALWGELTERNVREIWSDLEELPLPYRFDVVAFARITEPKLREHIERIGQVLYPAVASGEVDT